MNMTRHLPRWLNNRELARMDNHRYEGIIADVLEEPLNNKFKGTKQLEPVVVFEDGWRLCPNLAMRHALTGFWGYETDEWIGRRIVVFLHRVDRVDEKTRKTVSRWQKRVMRPGNGGT